MYAACLLATLVLAPDAPKQAVPDSVQGRPAPFYVGVQAGAYRYAGLGQRDSNGRMLSYRGLMPVVGFRFSKRSSLEISAMWRRTTNGPLTVIDYPDGSRYRYYNRYGSVVVPVLFRYAFVAVPRRWNVEGVAGFSLLHYRVEGRRSTTAAGQPEPPFEIGGFSEANDVPLTLGAAVTYTPTRHLTLVAESRLNWSVLGSSAAAIYSAEAYAPQPGASIGLRYNFGLK
ncbi:hypothetical protein [Hymenobacter sp. DG01]|uniref:hypothetical protein n=1 Tax=Hymenobacter sp. DG01 TaxID=2584940 RepID=UPI0011218823|nr:hypothetical protein [Hymenobacter sp. DG01]